MTDQKFFDAAATTTTKSYDGITSSGYGDGHSKRLYVGRHGSSGTRRNYTSFLQFTADWTNVKRIASAYLILYTEDYDAFASAFTLPASSDSPSMYVRRLTSAPTFGTNADGTFDSSDFTNPGKTTSDQVYLHPSKAALELVRIDITEIVEDFAPATVLRHDSGVGAFAAGSSIVRVGLYGDTNTKDDVSFASMYWADAQYRPKIELNYELGATTPATPTNLTPNGSVASIGGFQGDFSDQKPTDYLAASQVQVYGPLHAGTGTASNDRLTVVAHGLKVGDQIYFTSLTGGTGLSTFTKYYVKSVVDSDHVTVSLTNGGVTANITVNYSALSWAVLLWDSGTVNASQVERTNSRSDVTPGFTPKRSQTISFRIRQRDNESLWSEWSALSYFAVTNTDPTASGGTPNIKTFATLDGVHFKGTFADADGDHMLAYQIEMSSFPSGDAHWDDPDFILWDTGKNYVGAGATGFDTTYGGEALAAGAYYWRFRVWDQHDGVSPWYYRTLTLSANFEPDPELASQSIQLRPRAPWRVVIKNMGALRGPGNVVAILENAHKTGASLLYNSPGEAHWTIPVDHPQISVIEPKQTHYSIQFYAGDGWREKFAGLVWDFDATERDVVFYGIDYLALYDYTMDERYDPSAPDKPYTQGGSKYVDVTISTVVSDQLTYAKNLANSPVGFITIGAIATMSEKVTIFSTFVPTLQLVTGLLDSHRGGADKRTRVQVRPKTGGGYEVIVQDNPGVTRTNLRLRYGELVQGYRTVAFGPNWSTRVNVVGRQRDGVKVSYERATGPVSETTWGRFAKATVVSDVEDALDLRRRALQLANSNAMLGQQIGLGIRTGMLGPRDGYDVTDKFPISIQHGAVNTDNFGHDGLWVCLGVTWEAEDQGQQSTILTFRPPQGGSAPSGSLLDSLEISPQAEWQVGWTAPEVVHATSKYWLDQTTGKVYIRDGFGTPVAITGSH